MKQHAASFRIVRGEVIPVEKDAPDYARMIKLDQVQAWHDYWVKAEMHRRGYCPQASVYIEGRGHHVPVTGPRKGVGTSAAYFHERYSPDGTRWIDADLCPHCEFGELARTLGLNSLTQYDKVCVRLKQLKKEAKDGQVPLLPDAG